VERDQEVVRVSIKKTDAQLSMGELENAVAALRRHEAEAERAVRDAEDAAVREAEVSEIDADEALGVISADEAQRRRRKIKETLAEAVERRDHLAKVVETLQSRVAEQAAQTADAMLREATVPVAAAHERVAEAERHLAGLRDEQTRVVRAARAVQQEANELQARYARSLETRAASQARALATREQERRREELLRWAVTQGNDLAVSQLAPELQQEARDRIDRRNAEAAQQRGLRRAAAGLEPDTTTDVPPRIPTGSVRRIWDHGGNR
jgi:hypothetical protein